MSLYPTKASRKRKSLLEQANANSLNNTIPKLTTAEEKRQLIAETNPLLYLFGTTLNPANYMENEDEDN
jgi:hypothetical protein